MNKILNSLEDEFENETISLKQVMSMNPDILTLSNPMTFIMYLDLNKNLQEEERNIVIKIIKLLNEKQQRINEINLKKFEDGNNEPKEFENKIIYHTSQETQLK